MSAGHRCCALAGLLACMAAVSAHAQTSRPDPANTPGAINPSVTPDTLATTICSLGWARTVRPPRGFTSYLKRRQLAGRLLNES